MNIAEHIHTIPGLQYYVLMIDYAGKIGIGADVAPERVRRTIVQEVCDCIEAGRRIVHVKYIDGNDMQDVTHEIITEALALKAEYDAQNDELDRIYERQCSDRDRARGYRNEVA